MNLHEQLHHLGSGTVYRYDQPDASLLERFPNPFAQGALNPAGVTGTLNITCPEFTSLCPVTGQPDWAGVQIRYAGPQIEQGGLLRYLVSFRRHNDFHEHCVERIFTDLLRQCRPSELCVWARYTRRGGLDINPCRRTAGLSAPAPIAEVRQ